MYVLKSANPDEDAPDHYDGEVMYDILNEVEEMAKFPTHEEMVTNLVEEALDGYIYEGKTLREWIDILKQLREQESKIKVLDDMEAAKRLGTVDVYMASAWLKFIKDLKILGLRVCEVTESEGEK